MTAMVQAVLDPEQELVLRVNEWLGKPDDRAAIDALERELERASAVATGVGPLYRQLATAARRGLDARPRDQALVRDALLDLLKAIELRPAGAMRDGAATRAAHDPKGWED